MIDRAFTLSAIASHPDHLEHVARANTEAVGNDLDGLTGGTIGP